MQAISVLDALGQAALFLAIFFVVGGPLAFLATRAKGLARIRADRLSYATLALAFGVGTVPLILSLMDLLSIPFTPITIWATFLIFLVASAIVLFIKREGVRSLVARVAASLRHRPARIATLLPALIFLAILLFHVMPTVGLYVHPGDDPKLYTLISVRILEERGFAEDWGVYAPQAWFQEKTHLLIPGYAALVAYLQLLTDIPIEQIVTLTTVTFTALISMGIYLLARSLSLSKPAGLASALAFGLLNVEPNIGWFGWGGNAELSSLFLLPVTVGLVILLTEREAWGLGTMVATAVLMAGMFLIHPFSAFYLGAFLLPYALLVYYRKRRIAPVLFPFAAVALGLGMLGPVLIRALPAEAAIGAEYALGNPGWTPIFALGMDAVQALGSVAWRVAVVYGVGVVLFLIAVPWLLKRGRWYWKPFLPLGLWMIALFLLHENNPNGLFTVEFPLWYRVDANRAFSITSLPLSVVVGSLLIAFGKDHRNTLKSLVAWIRGPARRSLAALPTSQLVRVGFVSAVLLIQLVQVGGVLVLARNESPVSQADAEALQWISENIDEGTFYVSWADAGTWIAPSARHRVVIPFGVITNYTFYDEYFRIDEQFRQDPESLSVLSFLNEEGVDYVYVGPRRIYDRPGLDAAALEKSAFYETVYNRSGVHIFAYRGAEIGILWEFSIFDPYIWTGGLGGEIGFRLDGLHLTSLDGNRTSVTMRLTDGGIELDEDVVFLEVRWRTEGEARLSLDIQVGDATHRLIDQGAQGHTAIWMFKISNFGPGRVTSFTFFTEGFGTSIFNSMVMYRAVPAG
jgi:hypothetical protein